MTAANPVVRKPAVFLVNNTLDVIQLVCCEDDPAKSYAPTNRPRARS